MTIKYNYLVQQTWTFEKEQLFGCINEPIRKTQRERKIYGFGLSCPICLFAAKSQSLSHTTSNTKKSVFAVTKCIMYPICRYILFIFAFRVSLYYPVLLRCYYGDNMIGISYTKTRLIYYYVTANKC